MQTLPHSGFERAGSRRDQNLVGMGQLGGPEAIERVIELNVKGAVTRRPLSHVADGRRREMP